jgi:cyclophilin family peptidyl-prolyl cis-trans isomerase/HEAT repeat protein
VRRPAAAALLVLAACSSRPATPTPDPAVSRRLADIALAEDERTPHPYLMVEAALTRDPALQERAAVALGRLMRPDEGAFLGLLYGLGVTAEVKRAALFAMGQLGLGPEPPGGEDLRILGKMIDDALDDGDDETRAVAVEAMGKIDLERAPRRAIDFLSDRSPLVRRQAASACFRWRQVLRWRDPKAKAPDLAAEVVDALSARVADADAEVRWRSIHALLRSGAQPSPAVVNRYLVDREPLCRLFALGVVERHKIKNSLDLAARAQTDPDAQVRQAALRALDALERPDLLHAPLIDDPSHHVRVAVADLVDKVGPELDALSRDASPAVRAAALIARVRISEGTALPHLERGMADPETALRLAAARGAGELKAAGLPLLGKALKDESELVRAAAYAALADIEGAEAWGLIREGLGAPGLGERSGAVEALAKRKESDALDRAMDCFKHSKGREWVEIREVLVDFIEGKPAEATNPFLLEAAKSDPAASVRQKAATVLKRRGVKDVPEPGVDTPRRTPHFGKSVPKQPVVYLQTTKGTIEITCFPDAAPVHAANFLGLVEQGFYNGLTWHRVVSNFVIQGGDPLGNGMGDAGWNLRAEINPIPFERGTLGMPRSAGFDTGGCQLFITHLPTPHLDGYYTVFGKVTRGMDVVDRIEAGDRIVEASVLP